MKDIYKILLVDDSESDRGTFRRYLLSDQDFDYQILEAENLEEALELWRSQSADLVLTDFDLPDGNGLEILQAIQKTTSTKKIPLILMTGQGDERLAVQAIKQGASDYLVKNDITASTLCHYVETAIAQWKFSEKLTQLRQELEIKDSVLKFKDDLFQAIFDNAFQFIGLISPDGIVLEANQTALTVIGLQKQDVVGCLMWETDWFKISRHTQEKLKQSVLRAAQGEFIRYEMDIWDANQRVISIDFSLRPIFNESNQIIALIPEGRDITEAKRLIIEKEQALAALKEQKDLNQLIAEISSRFVEVNDETLDGEIDRSLQLIAEMIQVDTGYLFTLDRDRQTLSMSHEWSQPGSLRQIAIAQNIPFAAFPYSIALILQQKVCCVNDTELLPPEAAVDAASWQQFKIKSLLSIPLTHENQTIGILGLASFNQAIAWDEEIIQVLTVLSQTITNTQARIEAENIRKQNEIELKKWRKRYELAEQASGQMIYEYNFLTDSVIWGANATLILGYAEPDLPHHLSEWFTLIHPEDLSIFQQALETATANKTSFFCQYRFLHQAGYYVWLEDCNQWLLDEQGEGIGVIGMITDISDKKNAELLLRKQALVFENITDGVIITDIEGSIIDWNRGAENLYGYTKAEVLGKSPSLLHTLEDSQWLQTDILQTTLQNGFWSGEIAVICKDGSKKITTTSTVLLQDDQKNNIAVIGLNHDITKLKETQEELRQSNEELEQLNKTLEARVKERTYELETREAELFDLFDNATDLIQRVSPEGKLLFVNRAWRESLGYCDHELEQLSIFQIIHPSDLEHCQAMMARIFAGEPCIGIETRFLTKDGKEIIVQGNVNCQFQDGQAIATRGIFRDISDRKQMELNLQQSEKINRTILETMPDLIIHMDSEGNYIRKSQGQNIRVIGLDDFSLQLKVENILPHHLAQQQIYFANLALQTGTLQIFEQIVDFPDEQRFEEVRIAPLNAQEVLVIIRDITDRRLAEEALKASERRFSTLVSTSPVGIFRFDRPLNCVYVNERWCEITGRSAASAMGRGWIDAIHPDERDFFREHIDHDFYSPSPQQRMLTGEGRHLLPDGSINWCYFQAVHEFNESGEVIGYIGTVTDITDRKQAEQQLQNLTDRLKIALNSGAIGCWEWEIVNETATWDERMYELYGIPQGTTVLFDTWANSLHPDDREAVVTLIQETIAGKTEYDMEYRVIHSDDSIHFLKGYGVVVRDSQGIPQRIIGVNFEITEQKQAEQTIRQQIQKETLLRQITQHMRETLDLQTIFDTACQEIRQFIHSDRVGIFKFYAESGFDDGEFVAESVKEGLSSVLAIQIHDHCFGADYAQRYTEGHFQVINDVLQSDLQDCHKAILSQFEIRANLVIPLLCGENLWGLLCIHTCAAPRIWQPDEIDLIQQIAGQLAIAIQQADLFEQLQKEKQKLIQSNKDLARATRLKDEFLANMSHELRTPLTAILGMSEALQENTFGDINPSQEKAIKLIEKSGDHLLSLINDILDLSKIEAGKLELELSSISVQTLCENSTMFVKQMAFTKNINLQTQIAENIDQIRVDEFRIRQSLINLLSNAIKFTPAGGNVILSVELEETEILFSVTDTGIGISSTDLDKLFQPFIQIDSSLNRQYAGTGLGLVLVERIITKHGGRVSVTSRVGEGSCFTLRLPYVPSSRKIIPEGVDTISLLPNKTNAPLSVYPLILLADDNEANRQTLDDYLSNKGYRMLLAYNGKEAVEIVKTHRPDLILMDIQMPEMDGLEATTLIRSDPAIAHIPIIALTALALPDQAEQCFHAGFDEYLAKPVRFKILMETIQKFCQRHED